MLGVSAILFFGVFLQTTCTVQGTSASFDCSDRPNGNYPDPTSDFQYITCSNGHTYHMLCPADLVWNVARKICDWKQNVSPSYDTSIGPTTSPPSNFTVCAGRENGSYPDPNDCRGYIACANGITYHMPCPAELKWNDAQKICDWPQNANPSCGASSNSAPSYSCQVQVISNNVCSGEAYGNFPDSSNCHGYIACTNGLTYHMPCPHQLKWNDRLKICDLPHNAYPACPGSTAAPTTSSGGGGRGGEGGNFCQDKSNGNYPDANNCYGYIACSNGFTHHMACPARLKWNDNLKRCDLQEYANPDCSGTHQWPSYHCVSSEGKNHSDFCSNKTNGYYPDSANSHGYIECSNGISYNLSCPASLVWNDATKRCQHDSAPYSVDDIVHYVLDAIPSNISGKANNHLVGALYQVVKGMEAAKGIPRNVSIDKDEMIDRIKKAMDHKGYTYARTVMGFILHKHENRGEKTGGRIIEEIKDALGKDKFQDFLGVEGDVSLVFVIDTTGSMREEISQAKAIAKAIARYERKGKVDYILSPYNDPGSGPVKKYNIRSQFEAAIDRLSAYGGGDCNELTFNGIIDAIKIGNPLPSSPMYVLTDAPPKVIMNRKQYNRDNAIRYAKDYMMQVNFFFSTLGCGEPANNADYKAIMAATGGLGLFFQTASAISSADAIVKVGLDGSTIISSGRSISSSNVVFPVDESVASLIVSISAESNWNNVNLVDPSGRNVFRTLAMNRGQLWLIKSPNKGTWRLSISPNVRGLSYEIEASALSNIEFDQTFVRTLKPSGLVVPISNPLIGEKATMKLLLPHISRLNRRSLKADLVNERGESIKNLTINGDTATFDLPSAVAFRIRLTGETHDGNAFQRLSREEVRPQAAVLRTRIKQSLLTIKRGSRSLFHAALDYLGSQSKTFTLRAFVVPSNVSVFVRSSLTVTNAHPGLISVYLTAPAGTPVGTVVKVHVLAYSGGINLNLLAHLMVK